MESRVAISRNSYAAQFLAVQIVRLTNGASATIGKVVTVPDTRLYTAKRWARYSVAMRMRWIEASLTGGGDRMRMGRR